MRNLLLLFALASSLWGADPWKVGFNFRSTSGFVTDGADEVYVLGETSSTTRSTANGNSATFIWSAALSWIADRDDGLDARLAGDVGEYNIETPNTFTVTLPSTGTYKVRIAIGDIANADARYVVLKDNGNVLLTLSDATPSAGTYLDASAVERTTAALPGSNASVNLVFTTTTFQMVVGTPTYVGGLTPIAHLYLEYVPPAGGARKRFTVID